MSTTSTRRQIVVTALGSPPPIYPGPGHSEDVLVARMVEFWQRQLEIVLPDRPDLIVLPELCDRYDAAPVEATIALRAGMAEAMGPALANTARENGCHVVHATALSDDRGVWHNSAALLDPTGTEVARYDKLRLVPTEYQYGLQPGHEPVVVETDFGRVGFVLCFDLNFIELIDLYRPLAPDVMIFPSRYHGGLMQQYWAYQLRSHFIGAVGIINLTSDVLSPVGHRIAASTNYESWVTTTINTNCAVAHLDDNRAGPLPELKRQYGTAVTITDPGELGSVLVTSNDPSKPVNDLLTEFGIERLDDYLVRARAVNKDALEALTAQPTKDSR